MSVTRLTQLLFAVCIFLAFISVQLKRSDHFTKHLTEAVYSLIERVINALLR